MRRTTAETVECNKTVSRLYRDRMNRERLCQPHPDVFLRAVSCNFVDRFFIRPNTDALHKSCRAEPARHNRHSQTSHTLNETAPVDFAD